MPKCENPSCPKRPGGLKTLLDHPRGVLLHKQWLCSPGCLAQVLETLLSRLVANSLVQRVTRPHRFPLGLIMLSLGWINKESLQSALSSQRQAGKGRVGDWLRRQGVVTEAQVTQALSMQWSLPIYPLETSNANLNWTRLVPLPLLDAFRMLPVHCTPALGMLHVAFSNQVDYTALYAIEQMLDCHTRPCVAQESCLDTVLEQLHRDCAAAVVPIEGPAQPAAISKTTVEYALRFQAEEVRVVACADNIWVRLRTADGPRDLLFRCASPNPLRADGDSMVPIFAPPPRPQPTVEL
jgi:hypothetical protein